MPKKPGVRTLMDSKHAKVSETLLKSAGHYFSDLFWSFRKKISLKKSNLVVSKILRMFANILTADDKYSLSVKVSV